MKIVTSADFANLSLPEIFKDAFKYLEHDLGRWKDFKKSPRHAVHFPHGVFELMPCADDEYYTYKYVNAHPANPKQGKLSIIAVGMLADIETGYPQMFCDMTILTAMRTAAGSAIATKHFAAKDASVLGMIGTGAQSEFQVFAMQQVRDIKTIRYYDRDPKAMEKFANNMAGTGLELIPCKDGTEVVQGVDIVTTCICEKKHVKLFPYEAVKDNKRLFINGIGGDCPGKTELDPEIMKNSRIVVEFHEQTKYEGEVQNLEGDYEYDELWEIVQGVKPGRTEEDGIIVYDAVGFGLADFSIMRLFFEKNIGQTMDILPELKEDPKNLYSVFNKELKFESGTGEYTDLSATA